jgi:hypothetical protein
MLIQVLDQFELARSFFRAVLLQHLQVGHAQVSFKQQLTAFLSSYNLCLLYPLLIIVLSY